MSEPTQEITREDVRAIRHAGFDDSIAYMNEANRERLIAAHRPQDARREENITGFYGAVLASDA